MNRPPISDPVLAGPAVRRRGRAVCRHGYEVVENPVHVRDWHATILHLLGLDQEKLTYRYSGREMQLTDVKGKVVNDIIA
jgi:hypothetical protein